MEIYVYIKEWRASEVENTLVNMKIFHQLFESIIKSQLIV